ncbi:hypothetical protein GGP62_002170 [Salinibacter ruber]|uniref:DUF3168 domain-containing protein n=1 Tax=Salinibacter ruber TaxID=146919 RepID=UPI0021678D22|nr:DUF3168 domain-containing protein [Salinibacter ruber]MCS3707183.1 hypothetical protein [Salinibacter ruber]
MTVETDLVTAFHRRLSGDDSHGQPLAYQGRQVPVYTGNAPADKEAPYVTIGRPRKRGEEALDGTELPEVRVQLRVHTAFPQGKGDHLLAYEIAGRAHDLLEAAPITVGGHKPYTPQPDLQPIPSYDKGDQQALDVSMDYRFPSL